MIIAIITTVSSLYFSWFCIFPDFTVQLYFVVWFHAVLIWCIYIYIYHSHFPHSSHILPLSPIISFPIYISFPSLLISLVLSLLSTFSLDLSRSSNLQYIPRNMHTVFALLCFVVVIHWLIFPYPSRLLHWHCGNLTIAPVPAKQPWWIWINTSCELIMNDCVTTTKQSTTKPCAYFLGYTVAISLIPLPLADSFILSWFSCWCVSAFHPLSLQWCHNDP